MAPAGGGIWRTRNALTGQPNWQYLSGPFGINAVGSIAIDPNDPSGNTLWVGTGEANSCGSGCIAGVGLYKTTDSGATWTFPHNGSASAATCRALTQNVQAGNATACSPRGVRQVLLDPAD